MYLPRNEKVLLALLMQSPMLGIIKAGGIYRLFVFEDLRIDQSELDIYGEHWSMSLDDFIDSVRIFPHEENEQFLLMYPQSANQMMLESIYSTSPLLEPVELAAYVKYFKPIQRGRIKRA